MYMFSRLATLRGSERRSIAWAVEMTNHVNALSDHTMTLWRTAFGHPVGTVAWATWAESMDALDKGFVAIGEDDHYHELVDAGLEFIHDPPQDLLRRAIHGAPGDTPPAPGAVTSVTTAVVGNGKYAEATAWGVEMAELVEEISGHATMFLVDSYGTFGQVTWLTGAPDLAAADASGEAVQSNPDYIKRLSDVGDLFVPGSGHQRLVSRIA
jgi:hypothetical protein